MKITVSRYWKLQFLSTFLIEGVTIGFLLLFRDIGEVIIGSFFVILMMSSVQILCIVVQHRFLSHVIYENDTYTSFFWRKELCIIHENASVFYAKIHARISTEYYADFVLISTESFEYRDVPTIRWRRKDPKPIQVSYDVKKMILLPYEENAPYLSKISQWKRIYPSPNI